MFRVDITYEGKRSMKEVEREFHSLLSDKEIQKAAAKTINVTSRRVVGLMKKEVKKYYTINAKGLTEASKLSKPARGTKEGLYAEVSYSTSVIGLNRFKHNNPRHGNPVTVEIKKGRPITYRHAFVRKMKSGHIGVFVSGSYVGKRFVPSNARTSSGKTRITNVQTASPYTMYSSKAMSKQITSYIDRTLAERYRVFLRQTVDKLTQDK